MDFIIKELPAPLLSDIRRVTCLWIGRLGDFLIATPFLRSVKRRFPEAHLVLVVGEKGRSVAGLCPDGGEVRTLHSAMHPIANAKLLRELHRPSELLIDLNSSFSRASAALSLWANARAKLAFDKKRAYWAYSHLIQAPADTEHMLDRYERLAAAIQAPYEPLLKIQLRDEDRRKAKAILQDALPKEAMDRRKIAIHPGNFKKYDNRWPEEKFAALTDLLLDRPDVEVFYMAGPGEERKVAEIVAGLKRRVPILPPVPVGVAAAALSLTDLLICNATGTTHLAVAVGTPTFSLLGRYTKTVWMPRTGPHFSVVSDSWTSCRDIPVDAAWKGLQHALESLFRS